MFNTMCDNLDNARLNRERVKQGITNRFYAEQAHAAATWKLGEPPPNSVILGSLPQIHGHIAKKERSLLDYFWGSSRGLRIRRLAST